MLKFLSRKQFVSKVAGSRFPVSICVIKLFAKIALQSRSPDVVELKFMEAKSATARYSRGATWTAGRTLCCKAGRVATSGKPRSFSAATEAVGANAAFEGLSISLALHQNRGCFVAVLCEKTFRATSGVCCGACLTGVGQCRSSRLLLLLARDLVLSFLAHTKSERIDGFPLLLKRLKKRRKARDF